MHFSELWVQARRSLSEQPDIHARLMAKYPQVPEWWYASIFGMSRLILDDTIGLKYTDPVC
jgi:hypothetical protein